MMRVIDESQQRTIALATQMHELALKQASASTRSAFVATDGTLIDVPLLGPALPATTPEQTQAVIAFMRRELSQIPDLPATRWRRRLTEAQIFEGEGNLPAAISSYRESATLIEQERRTLPSDAARAGFTNDKVHVFDRLVLTLLSRARLCRSLSLERAGARPDDDRDAVVSGRATADRHRAASLLGVHGCPRGESSGVRDGRARTR